MHTRDWKFVGRAILKVVDALVERKGPLMRCRYIDRDYMACTACCVENEDYPRLVSDSISVLVCTVAPNVSAFP